MLAMCRFKFFFFNTDFLKIRSPQAIHWIWNSLKNPENVIFLNINFIKVIVELIKVQLKKGIIIIKYLYML